MSNTLDFGNDKVNKIGKAATIENKTLAGNVPQGNFELGDEYIINVDGIHNYHFYVLSIDGDKVNLIMSNNICSDGTLATSTNRCTIPWTSKTDYNDDSNWGKWGNNNKGPITAMNYLYETTKNWSNIENIQMDYIDEGNTGAYGYGSIKTKGNITSITSKDGIVTSTYDNLKARLAKYSEITGTGCNNAVGSCPTWMVNGLEAVPEYYPIDSKENIPSILEYWGLSSSATDVKYAIFVGRYGDSTGFDIDDSFNTGIRPVIEVLKSNLSQ